jgi:omega-hydroxy-beta-dihydromenaquinone-9 sulfotransferase
MKSHAKSGQPATHSYPFWCVRFWHGLRIRDWMRLLIRNRFRIHPFRWAMACGVTAVTPFNSSMRLLQQAGYGRKIEATTIDLPPVFIIGHWRSGTTLLHELMMRDQRCACPTTFECFAPHHFLVTGWFFTRFGGFLVPKLRPMDNMAAGFQRPQEDEFALMTLGMPSPYWRMAFPNHAAPDMEWLEMEGIDPGQLEVWKQTLHCFLKTLTFKHEKRIILKSPPHTGRVGVLAELFPHAKFIHLTRNPYELFSSTRRLWQSLDSVQALQMPHHRDLDEYVFDCLNRMYRGFHRQRSQIDPSRILDIRYEELVQDPLAQMRGIYQQLDLGDFEPMRSSLEAYVAEQKDYRANTLELDAAQLQHVRRRWHDYFERYGYAEKPASA